MVDKTTNRRYYLHRAVKKQFNARVSPRKKLVYIAYNLIEEDKVKELQTKFNYTIQTEIV
ncbi:hypothetical protein V3Q90_05320 [Flavobacterium oreochromis]|uniref:Uncharacterized protein n=1 Tax=Flavobacterium davisii TaxID=2906077 RepID=A0A246GF62_9FLAO|nr:hypothetical protein BWK59_14195 [Flavobacterium davisii]